MPNYLLAFHGGTPQNDDEQATVMEAWNDWLDENGEAIVDIGNPVAGNVVLKPDGSTGPVAGEAISGYTIIEAEDLDEAVEIARGCPILAANGTVEIGELLDVGEETEDEDEDEDDD